MIGRFCRVVAAAASAVLLPHGVAAQANPSLATTTSWLQTNLPGAYAGADVLDFVTEFASYRFDGCSMTMDVTMRLSHNQTGVASGNVVYFLEVMPALGYTFDVETVKESGEINGPQMLEQRTTVSFRNVQPNIALSKHVVGDPNDNFILMTALNVAPRLIAFTTDDALLAPRLQKALTHLAALCGAKPEPF